MSCVQGFHEIINGISTGTEVVIDLEYIVDFQWLKSYRYFTGSIEFDDLLASQTITGHPAGTVRQIYLQVFVDSVMIVLSTLGNHLSCGTFIDGRFAVKVLGFRRVIGDDPGTIYLRGAVDLASFTIASYGALVDIPTCCDVFG